MSAAVSRGILVGSGTAGDDGSRLSEETVDQRLRLALGATLLIAAAVHVSLGLQHSPSNFGALSLGSGAVQFLLAVSIILRSSRRACRVAVMVSLVLIELYVLNVTVGLPPLIAHSHSVGTHELFGLKLAAAAPVDVEGLLAKSAELSTIFLAGLLMRSARNH